MKKHLLFPIIICLTLFALSGWYVYKNPEGILHYQLVPPDYFWLSNSKDIYRKTGIVSIANREIKIPIAYVEGRFIDGKKEDSVLLTYVLPNFKSKLSFASDKKRLQLFNEGYYSSLLLEESAIRPSFDEMIKWRKRDLIKSEAAGTVHGLEYEKWYRGTKENPIHYYEIYYERGDGGDVQSFIQCAPLTRPAVVRSGCKHKFRNKGLLYGIFYNKNRYFADWREQRRAAIKFIDSLEIHSNSTQEN